MSQRTLPRGSENRKYRSLLYKERYSESLKKEDDTNKEDSFKHQKRETLRDLTYKYTRNSRHLNTNNTNERKVDYKSFRETIFGKDLLSSHVKKEDQTDKIENHIKPTFDTNKFFTELSKEEPIIQNQIDKKSYSEIDKIIEVENYFEKIYGKNGIKGMTVEFYDLESIKNTKLYIPKWLLKDNSEELFEEELPPQDITVYNLWFFRRKNEGSPEFVQKGIKPISNADILLHLESIYNVSREAKRSGTGSKMIRIILDGLRKVNNYMLYIGSETRYPNNVMEKTPRLVEKLEKILESIRPYKNYEENKYMANDEKAIKYAKELLDVAWMNFNVRTIDDSKNRVIFRKAWIGVNKELEEIIEKYIRKNRKVYT